MTGGGCFGEKIYHIHKGNETSGGECYNSPVYHEHTGNTQTWGGCYNSPVYHLHTGDENSGGACYEPVYHQHAQTCNKDEECKMTYVGELTIVRTYDDWCSHHGNSQITVITAHYKHSSCGAGTLLAGHTFCWTCKSFDKVHDYQVKVCGKNEATIENYRMSCGKGENVVDSWQLQCNKNQTTIERYENSCGKTDQNIDSYNRNCDKNEASIDAYAQSCLKEEGDVEFYVRNCGKEEGTVYGYLSVSSSNTQWTSGSIILNAFHVQNGLADLQSGSEYFVWEKDGTILKTEKSDQIQVTDNGKYIVKVMDHNRDTGEEELSVAAHVKNIDKTPPVIKGVIYNKEEKVKSNTIYIQAADLQPDGSTGSGLAAAPYSYDGGKTWKSGDKEEVTENGVIEIKVKDACGNIAAKSVTIENIQTEDDSGNKEEENNEEDKEEEDKDKEEDDDKKEEGNGGNNSGDDNSSDEKKEEEIKEKPPEKKESITIVPEDTSSNDTVIKSIFKRKKKADPVIKEKDEVKKVQVKETETVIPEPKAAEPVPDKPVIKTVSNKNVISPIVKAFTFTIGGVAGVATLIWMCYLFFTSIRIYHSDGDGKTNYAGSCIIKKTENIFEVTIPAMILEQSDTGRFSLRLGGVFYKYHKGKELIVTAGQHKESVWIDKEIPFRVDTYV